MLLFLKIFINFYIINYALNADKFGFGAGDRGINYNVRQGKSLSELNIKSLRIARYAFYIER